MLYTTDNIAERQMIVSIITPSADARRAMSIAEQFRAETGKNLVQQPVENRRDVERGLKLLDSLVPQGEAPNCLSITANYPILGTDGNVAKYAISDYNLDEYDFLIVSAIAGPQLTSGNPTWAEKYSYDSYCPECGNRPYCTDIPDDFKFKRLPKKQSLFSFYPPPLYFAREKFIKAYERAGLTGLTFESMPEDLFLVKVVKHRWNDRVGVCDKCEMKTNVVSDDFFNLPENYLYDIQRVEVNCGSGAGLVPHCVVTPKAFKFLKLGIWSCFSPVMPYHLSDLVWPAPRMFTNGTYPITVYREE